MSPKPVDPPPVETCEQYVAEIDAYWNAERRAALQAHAGAGGDAVDYAISTIDGLVEDWKRGGEPLCKGNEAPDERDRERLCRTAWLEGFDRTVALLIERGDAQTLARALRQQVPRPLLEQVGELSNKLSGRVGNGLVSGWRTATDLTANRVGFVVSNDLETAAKAIATEGAALSSLSVKDRLRDLLSFAVSEQYFNVRRHLGLHVREEASA